MSFAHFAFLGCSPYINGYCRVVKRSVDVVDRDWIVGVRRVATDVDHNRQASVLPSGHNLFRRYKVRNPRVQIDTVDKNVNLENLRKWTSLGCFCQVPLENIIPSKIVFSLGTEIAYVMLTH